VNPLAIAFAALVACTPTSTHARREVGPRSGPYSFEIVDEGGRRLPTFEHRGRTWVLGSMGERYLLRVRNDSPRRVEVVASVDGRDVVDGRPASLEKRGYLVAPYGELTVDGFRLSQDAVAAFRFSSVSRSYAARMGDARDVGVIGVAVFPEQERRWSPPPLGALDGPPRAESSREAGPEPRAGAPAGAGADAHKARSPERPGLGTEFGEEHRSRVEHVAFVRAGERPEALLTLRYDDRRGLAALGIDVDGRLAGSDRWLRETAQPFRGWAEPPPGWGR